MTAFLNYYYKQTREEQATHYLTLEARDNLGRGNRGQVELVLQLEDENDNAPQFMVESYQVC